MNILAYTTDAPISAEQLTKIRKLLKKHNAQCQRESSRTTTDQTKSNKVNKKLSNGENIEDSGLHDMTGEDMHLRKRVARVSCFSAASHEECVGSHSQNSNSYGKKLFAESSGAQWDVFRRQDVPKLIEYLQRHSNEFSHMSGLHKHVSGEKEETFY